MSWNKMFFLKKIIVKEKKCKINLQYTYNLNKLCQKRHEKLSKLNANNKRLYGKI